MLAIAEMTKISNIFWSKLDPKFGQNIFFFNPLEGKCQFNDQHLELVVVIFKAFRNHCCFVAGSIILLKETTAIRECLFHEWGGHVLQQSLAR